jgi:hypothetical protein
MENKKKPPAMDGFFSALSPGFDFISTPRD